MPSYEAAEERSTPRLKNMTERDLTSEAKFSCSILRNGITQ